MKGPIIQAELNISEKQLAVYDIVYHKKQSLSPLSLLFD